MIGQIGMSASLSTQDLSSLSSTSLTRPDPAEMQEMMLEVEQTVSQRMGLESGTLTDLRSQIETRVNEEMAAAGEDADRGEIMDRVVSEVFEENGIDLEEFKSQMETVSAELGMPAPPQGPPPGGAGGGQGMSVSGVESDSESSLLALLAEETEESSFSSSEELMEWLRNLPTGSDVDIMA